MKACTGAGWVSVVTLLGCANDATFGATADAEAVVDSGGGSNLSVMDFDWDSVDLGAACRNRTRDPFETDVDCGGLCPRCSEGQSCDRAWDCQREVCVGGRCALSRLRAQTISIDGAPCSFAVADVTGDGRRDLVVGVLGGAPPAPYMLAVLGEGGGGAIQVLTRKGVGGDEDLGLVAIALGDFNGDKQLDVALGGTLSKRVWILHNQGGGVFKEANHYEYASQSLRNYRPLGAGDFDGDEDADLVVATVDEGLLLYRNSGRGLMAATLIRRATASAVAVADVDLDKAVDLLGEGGGVLSFTQKLQHVSAVPVLWTKSESVVAAADLNGDGWPDVANGESVCLNDGKGGFLKARPMDYSPIIQMVSGDFDGDGKKDLAAQGYGPRGGYEGVVVALGNASGDLRTSWRLWVPDLSGVGAGDLNGDGRDELFVGVNGNPREVRIYSVK